MTDNIEVKKFEGRTEYYKNGKLHRDNGPAIEYKNGNKWWYKNGLKHRDNGPAIEFYDGEKWWFKDGLRHRDNGPAVEYSDGEKGWYYKDQYIKYQKPNEKYTVEQFKKDISILILKGTI